MPRIVFIQRSKLKINVCCDYAVFQAAPCLWGACTHFKALVREAHARPSVAGQFFKTVVPRPELLSRCIINLELIRHLPWGYVKASHVQILLTLHCNRQDANRWHWGEDAKDFQHWVRMFTSFSGIVFIQFNRSPWKRELTIDMTLMPIQHVLLKLTRTSSQILNNSINLRRGNEKTTKAELQTHSKEGDHSILTL